MNQPFAAVVLDSEGLSAWVRGDRSMLARLRLYNDMDAELVVCANTIVEVSHSKTNMPQLQWVLSRTRVEPVTKAGAHAAAALLKQAGLHGHKYAIDATVAELALRQPTPVAIITSDHDDMTKLCGDRVRIVAV
ncbi:PIN domain-containing protein [Nocardia sp. NPDC019395]|uniref:PIN domain-containing protein n=1 Tax=Nocardia sp. NPDC019395 TaxID=3154686 RepID=UPI0033F90924